MKMDESAELRKMRWYGVHMIKTPGGAFEVTIDGFPGLKWSAPVPDEALSMAANALERFESEGLAVPDRKIYTWEEYVFYGLRPMGKMAFSDLPSSQRFLRRGYPTMWDKISATHAYPLVGGAEEVEVPAEEIVWHHVWGLTEELTLTERQERLLWSGNPNLHF